MLQLHLDVPDGGVCFGLGHFLLDSIRQLVDQEHTKVLVVVVLHHIHGILIIAVILAIAGGKVHFDFCLLFEHPDEPVVFPGADGKLVARQQNTSIIGQDDGVRLTICVELEGDQGCVAQQIKHAVLADRHQEGRQILVCISIEQCSRKLLRTDLRCVQNIGHVQRIVESVHQAVAGFWVFQNLPEQCFRLFFSRKYCCHEANLLSLNFRTSLYVSEDAV